MLRAEDFRSSYACILLARLAYILFACKVVAQQSDAGTYGEGSASAILFAYCTISPATKSLDAVAVHFAVFCRINGCRINGRYNT